MIADIDQPDVYAVGDIAHASYWFHPGENLDRIASIVGLRLANMGKESNVTFDEIDGDHIEVWAADDQRLPDPPESGMQCLVCWARVKTVGTPELEVDGVLFVAALDQLDRERLRKVTRRVAQEHNPGRRLTNAECDTMIARIGPKAAESALQEIVANKA